MAVAFGAPAGRRPTDFVVATRRPAPPRTSSTRRSSRLARHATTTAAASRPAASRATPRPRSTVGRSSSGPCAGGVHTYHVQLEDDGRHRRRSRRSATARLGETRHGGPRRSSLAARGQPSRRVTARPMLAPRPVRAPRGTELTCRGWGQEAALRMLMNNLDPEVAENPDAPRRLRRDRPRGPQLGRLRRDRPRAARGSPTTRRCSSSRASRSRSSGPTSGRRGCSSPTRTSSGKWATWDIFRELERAGLMMYGQMTAGSWIYIGTQGILQGTYETFAELARQHFGGIAPRAGSSLTAGLGGMGGAQPLAVTMNDGVCLAIEVDEARARRRLDIGYVDRLTADPAEALALGARRGRGRARRCRSRSSATPPRSSRPGPRPASGSTSSPTRRRPTTRSSATCRPRSPSTDAVELRADPARRIRPPVDARSMADHVRAMLAFQAAGAVVFDYGNNLRAQALEAGVADAFDYPGFVPAFVRPLFCEGRGPFRWAALSGDPADIARTDEAILELFPDDAGLHRWIDDGPGEGAVPGPAGADLLARLRRAGAGRPRVQRARRAGEVSGPDRHRPRPPRRGLRRLAEPRDRGDGRRLRRDRRLAAPQRPGQHRGRRDVGLDPPRRRRRDRLLAARRHGRRRRRHGARGARSWSGS